jgi:hypothetical protein
VADAASAVAELVKEVSFRASPAVVHHARSSQDARSRRRQVKMKAEIIADILVTELLYPNSPGVGSPWPGAPFARLGSILQSLHAELSVATELRVTCT